MIKVLTLKYSYIEENLNSLKNYKNLRFNLFIILSNKELLVNKKYYIFLNR